MSFNNVHVIPIKCNAFHTYKYHNNINVSWSKIGPKREVWPQCRIIILRRRQMRRRTNISNIPLWRLRLKVIMYLIHVKYVSHNYIYRSILHQWLMRSKKNSKNNYTMKSSRYKEYHIVKLQIVKLQLDFLTNWILLEIINYATRIRNNIAYSEQKVYFLNI